MTPNHHPTHRSHDFRQRPLTFVEARILGTLMEKARTVPDSYPLTCNSLVAGCNQKSSRDPVLQLPEAQVLEALDDLRQLHLVLETSGGRVTRYEHNFLRVVGVPAQSAVLLAMLLLRGPQTAGELRLNTERWHKFLDIASVDAFLEELQERSPERGGALVLKLPRAPAAREQRWAHLLCGPLDSAALEQAGAGAAGAAATEDLCVALTRRVAALEERVAQMQDQLHSLHEQLGLSQPGQL